MARIILDTYHQYKSIITKTGETEEVWDGSVKNKIYNTSTLEWEAATGGGGNGAEVEVTNFPANPATSTLQSTGNTKLDSLLAELQLKADLAETQPVSVASLPLPSGAATSAKQDLLLAEIQVVRTCIVDQASATILYVGIADVGSSAAASVWQIKKLTTAGDILTMTFADGNSNYDNIWNNRASLTYS